MKNAMMYDTGYQRSHYWSACLAQARLWIRHAQRYPGRLLLDILSPLFIIAVPLALGIASSGGLEQAGTNFEANVGTQNYIAYMLIGANLFIIVSNTFWHITYWLRYEQETGTLETLYLTPTPMPVLGLGVVLYSAARSIGSVLISYLLGSLIFQFNPLSGDVLIAFAFLIVGLGPLYAIAFMFGALLLRIKQISAILGVFQWIVGLLMGMFFPIAAFPGWLQWIAGLLPSTWINQGVRSALLGIDYMLDTWYLDLAVLGVFFLLFTFLSQWMFARAERRLRATSGFSQF